MTVLAFVSLAVFLWLLVKAMEASRRSRESGPDLAKKRAPLTQKDIDKGRTEGTPKVQEPQKEPSPSATDAYRQEWKH